MSLASLSFSLKTKMASYIITETVGMSHQLPKPEPKRLRLSVIWSGERLVTWLGMPLVMPLGMLSMMLSERAKACPQPLALNPKPYMQP